MTSDTKPATTAEDGRQTAMATKAFAFALPQIGMCLMLGPAAAVLSGIYAKHYGMALTSIATVMLVARLFDAVTDPVIGYYSDRWQSKTGSRKPLVLIGGLLAVPCAYFLFAPPPDVSMTYFTFWYMAFYLALTLFAIPYMTWAHEFTTSTREKTLVFSAMAISGQAGGALFYLLPLLPFFTTTEITPQILKTTVLVGAAVMVPGLLLALKLVPAGTDVVAPASPAVCLPPRQRLARTVRALIGNRPFLLYVCAFMCLGIGVGMWSGMFFIFVDAYLKLGDRFSEVSLWGLLCGACAIPVWYRLTLLWGKRAAWLAGMSLLTGVFFFTGLLSPERSGFWPLFALNMLMTFATASMGVIAGPVLCDVIDYGRLKDGEEHSALYFSIHALMTKFQFAIGGGLGLGIVGWFGFDVNLAEQAATALTGLRLSVAWGPVLFTLLAMIFIALTPLNERRMVIIRQRLEARNRANHPGAKADARECSANAPVNQQAKAANA